MNRIEQKHRDAQSSFYLTLVSIMQSLALGYLLQTLGSTLIANGGLPWNMIFQSLTVLICIVLVWHEYAIGTVVYWWRLDIMDSAIPFIIGIAEYFSIAVIAIPETHKHLGAVRYALWVWSLAAFALTGTIAYINQSSKAKAEPGMKSLLITPKRNLRHAIGNMVAFACIALFISFFPIPTQYQWVISAAICGAFLLEVVRINKGYIYKNAEDHK
jgi:hypothetical protein